MRSVNYIIVGQGIAGSLLGHLLEKAGISFVVVDERHRDSSSRVGAGIINPVTGRNYVLAWEYKLHLADALATYSQLEQEIKESLVVRRNIIRTLFNPKDINTWQSRLTDARYSPFILANAEIEDYASLLTEQYQYGEVTGSYQLNMPLIMDYFAWKWRRSGLLHQEKFEYESLQLTSNEVCFHDVKADGLIFCEGQQVQANPFFRWLPIGDSKGEILKVKIPGFRSTKMIKQRRFLVPLEEDVFWFGSFDRWGATSSKPTVKGEGKLIAGLKKMINRPFELLSHEAALRPTTPDRRPLLGTHPAHQRLHIFNGLGTKGASLAPRWAKQMVRYLLEGDRLPSVVDVNRFSDLFDQH